MTLLNKSFGVKLIPLLCLVLLGACSQKVQKEQSGSMPNIIIVVADDLDFDELNFYDVQKFACYTNDHVNGRFADRPFESPGFYMPTLDKMAEEGIVFDNFYTPSAVCTSSRYALLTGKYPHNSPYIKEPKSVAKIGFNANIHPREESLAKVMNELGYTTAFFGKWHNGFNNKHLNLFEQKEEEDPETISRFTSNYKEAVDYLQDSIGFDLADRIMSENRNMHNLDWLNEGLRNFIDSNSNTPFFGFVSLPVPHGQYWNIEQVDTRYASNGKMNSKPEVIPNASHAIKSNTIRLNPDRKNMATWIDGTLDVILKSLKRNGQDENTLIIFTSDHQSRGKYSTYQSSHIPMLFWFPKELAPSRNNDLYSFIDLMPTLKGFANSKEKSTGVNMRTYLKSGTSPKRTHLFLECGYQRAIVTKQWKYIINTKVEESAFSKSLKLSFPAYTDPIQLYNLKDDLSEQKNLSSVKEYIQLITQLHDTLITQYPNIPQNYHIFPPHEPPLQATINHLNPAYKPQL